MSIEENIKAASRHILWNIKQLIENGITAGTMSITEAHSLINMVPQHFIEAGFGTSGTVVPSLTNLRVRKIHELGDIPKNMAFTISRAIDEVQNGLRNELSRLAQPQGFHNGRYRNGRRVWPQYRYGRIPAWRRPAVDYRDNYWIPPYEIPVEPDYFPGYNIVEVRPPYNDYYWPIR